MRDSLRLLLWLLYAGAAVGAAAAGQNPVGGQATDAGLMAALETAESAEIYVVRRELATPVGLDPFRVRRLGCRYTLIRRTPQWTELQSALTQAAVQIDDAPAYGEMRVGLVLGDRNGTRFEVYSGDLPMPDGRVKGYVQRREVGVSVSFALALHAFAEAHSNLARVERRSPHLCEGAASTPVRP